MNNIELRNLIIEKRIKFYEIAREVGIAPTTLQFGCVMNFLMKRKLKSLRLLRV